MTMHYEPRKLYAATRRRTSKQKIQRQIADDGDKLRPIKSFRDLTVQDMVRVGNMMLRLKRLYTTKSRKHLHSDEKKRMERVEASRGLLESRLHMVRSALEHPELIHDPVLRAHLLNNRDALRKKFEL